MGVVDIVPTVPRIQKTEALERHVTTVESEHFRTKAVQTAEAMEWSKEAIPGHKSIIILMLLVQQIVGITTILFVLGIIKTKEYK